MIGFLSLPILTSAMYPVGSEMDTVRMMHLDEVSIVSSVKEQGQLRQQPISVSLIGHQQMEARNVTSLKGASQLVPNLFIPDYGSRLTSAIYIRGIGSRINTPAVGLYVDNVPYVDKSAFDFNFYDIERVDVLRGPQGTLYGRNAMGGLVRVFTKNPMHYQGTDVRLGYATGDNHRSLSLTHYHKPSEQLAFSAGGYYEGGDGFFDNDCLGHKADKMQSGGGRMRALWLPAEHWTLDAIIGYDYSDEGAYPYYYTGSLSDVESFPELIGHISNNRDNSYRRSLFNVGLSLEYRADRWLLNAVTSCQGINDRMMMDQDFLTPDIYTLEQRQSIHTFNEEVTVKNTTSSRWKRVSGLNVMYQTLHTEAPVTFYGDGLRWLESNINGSMPSMDRIPMLQMMGFTGMGVNFRGDCLSMAGCYDTPTLSIALYHQSAVNLTEHLTATAGLRCEYEQLKMDYYSPAEVQYGFTMPNTANDKMAVNLQQLESHVQYEGQRKDPDMSLLPKLALTYDWGQNNLYASLSMGQRSGGYNVQMFGDLLQGALRVDMMEGVQSGVGGYLDELVATNPNIPKAIPDPDVPGTMVPLPEYVRRVMAANMPHVEAPTVEAVPYRPERSWNVELGTHLSFSNEKVDGQMSMLQMDAAVFYTRVSDQQIARFAASGLGRQMINAGQSESYGFEWSGRWMPDSHWLVVGSYGYTHSTFVRYDDGVHDYAGNYVPFVPMHTMNVDAEYRWRQLRVGANCTGTGRIYWTERNDVSQPFYTQLGARLIYEFAHATLTLWGKNLTDRRFQSFYFESASRGYEQRGKPLQVGVDVSLRF